MISALTILALFALALLLKLREAKARIASLEAQNASLRRLHSGATDRRHSLLRESTRRRA